VSDFEHWRARREQFRTVIRTEEPEWRSPLDVVEYQFGGRPFTELVAAAELADGAEPRLAGGYLGLTRADIRWQPHLLGDSPELDEHNEQLKLDGRTLLMGCRCTIWSCWPLYGRITTDESSVFWHDFHNPFQDWTYRALGPFRFERGPYEAELARLDR